ncbi:sensor histidine kinase [Nocardioides flavescens]|uniref:GAF domain-containing protein n=1 Tax=Nocardioides flavescens TaxID=2691959 RepID=A0A6L7F3N1_9ACTN|nr:GAF domain-containing protein [Nocardioides flavescens]MXG91834.1 GAF domain-containing protein [Nocardioides flavescens]
MNDDPTHGAGCEILRGLSTLADPVGAGEDPDDALRGLLRTGARLVGARRATLRTLHASSARTLVVVGPGAPATGGSHTALLALPVRCEGRLLAVVHVAERYDGGDFGADDEVVLTGLAALVGLVLDRERAREEARLRSRWLDATAEITARLLERGPGDEALQLVADRARELAGADIAWVVAGDDGDALTLRVVSGAEVDPAVLARMGMKSSLAAWVVRTGEPVFVDDLAADPRAVDPSAHFGWPRLGATVVVPLRSSDRTHGAVALAWTVARAGAAAGLPAEALTTFAEQAALALEMARSAHDERRLVLLEDRDRIARDLHDLVIQRLFAAGLGIERVGRDAGPGVRDRLRQAAEELDETIDEIRRSIFALGAPTGAGDLQSEVARLVERAGGSFGLRPELRFSGPVRTAVPAALLPDVLAVVGEALSNAGRHGATQEISVEVAADLPGRTLRIVVSDRGRGFDVASGRRSGLDHLASRAARLGGESTVTSAPGQGTTVRWTVPL